MFGYLNVTQKIVKIPVPRCTYIILITLYICVSRHSLSGHMGKREKKTKNFFSIYFHVPRARWYKKFLNPRQQTSMCNEIYLFYYRYLFSVVLCLLYTIVDFLYVVFVDFFWSHTLHVVGIQKGNVVLSKQKKLFWTCGNIMTSVIYSDRAHILIISSSLQYESISTVIYNTSFEEARQHYIIDLGRLAFMRTEEKRPNMFQWYSSRLKR